MEGRVLESDAQRIYLGIPRFGGVDFPPVVSRVCYPSQPAQVREKKNPHPHSLNDRQRQIPDYSVKGA